MTIKAFYLLCFVNLCLSLGLFCGRAQTQDPYANIPGRSQSSYKATIFDLSSSNSDSSSSNIDAALLNDLPEAPQTVQVSQSPADAASDQGQQTKRILGIIPNFRSVSANVHLPPQSVKEKFITATHDSFDYSSIFLPAAVAGYNQATNATPEFHQGAAGYGRYFWHTYVDQTSENYFVEFIVPAITHEDSRYYTLGSGGFWKRTGYSLSRAVITRSDAGHDTFNISEIVGAGAAAGVANFYYPEPQRTFTNTAERWGGNVGIDAATFLFHEFWPDINHALFHGNKPAN